MKILIEYKDDFDIKKLSSYGSIEHISKVNNFILLETDTSVEYFRTIDGIVTAYKERIGTL